MKKRPESFKQRLSWFLERCDELLFEKVIEFDCEAVVEIVPSALKELPLVWALLSWLLFSALWIAVTGPITFVAEAVLFPFAMCNEMRSSGELRSAWWRIILNSLLMGVIAVAGFWVFRLVGCAATFDEGIIEPRRKNGKSRYERYDF